MKSTLPIPVLPEISSAITPVKVEVMEPIRVAVHGASGRMGQEVIKALCHEPEIQVVGAVELRVTEGYLSLPNGSGEIPFSSDLAYIISRCQPHVLVDFTIAQATMPAVRIATKEGVNLVIGTTGLTAITSTRLTTWPRSIRLALW